jgi:hypothetical protein
MKHISASMNPWFLILFVTVANSIFGESPFGLAISFGLVQHVWATFAGFSCIRVKTQMLHMRNMVSAYQLSFSLVRHTLDNTILYSITVSPVLHFLISSVQWDITGTVRKGRIDKATLESDVALKKRERGTFDYRIDGKGNIVCRWSDNSVVTVASSGAGINPVSCQSLFHETERDDPSSEAKHDQSV